jgi:hypothetical protein
LFIGESAILAADHPSPEKAQVYLEHECNITVVGEAADGIALGDLISASCQMWPFGYHMPGETAFLAKKS